MATFPHDEVEAAFHQYVERGKANDWSAWADQFTDDAEYVEHEMGIFHGREAIREWITTTTIADTTTTESSCTAGTSSTHSRG